LLAALYVVSGGVLLQGDLVATPLTNTGFLAVGAVLASVVGTTGASMLLIRPLLQTNRERARVKHTVIFFIFIVSNIGGMLTPLGDPPLFLGYLQGVPFTWTFRLWPPWLLMVATLLLLYFVWDSRQYAQERPEAIRRDRRALLRHLPDHDPRPRAAARARTRAGRASALAVLLGDRRAVVVPRQRADLSRLPGPRAEPGAPGRRGRGAAGHPRRHQRG